MAVALHWIPESLYNSTISAVVSNYSAFQKEVRTFPENVLFDVYYKLYKHNRLCQLALEFSRLEVFARVLNVKDKRHLLHHCFQALMDHGAETSYFLGDEYRQHCEYAQNASLVAKDRLIQLGLSLGGFLCDAGWFPDSEKVMQSCLKLCKQEDDIPHWILILECCLRLLHVQNAYCKFKEAEETYNEAQLYVKRLSENNASVNLAGLCGEFAAFYFCRSHYGEAYKWSLEALKHLDSTLPPKTIIDVLRQSSKACIVKREFKRGEFLIKQALLITREHFSADHPKMADTLLDYGFYLLNVDCIAQSVKVYKSALDVRMRAFGGCNLHIAVAHEDLAYATYVNEYSSGRFQDAKDHAEQAMKIMDRRLPANHLMLASSKRVKGPPAADMICALGSAVLVYWVHRAALILEEIAIDNHEGEIEKKLLDEAHDLHLSALHLAKQAFGEMNVQTAKHYGNLGRLYQSMRRYNEAEEMHLKAISIKEQLLGPDDYEVALSVGHLASLYNYDMMQFKKAEELYRRSIAIGIKLFGEGYSGLEYDYRGLLRVYATMDDTEKVAEYTHLLHMWKELRDRTVEAENETSPLMLQTKRFPPEEILAAFLQIQ